VILRGIKLNRRAGYVLAGLVAAAALSLGIVAATSGTHPTTRVSTASPGRSGASTSLPAATSTTDATPETVNATVENQVIATTWKTFSTALAEDDMVTLATVSTPQVQQLVQGYFACGCEPWPVGDDGISFSAPPTTNYPRYFYADISGHNYDGTPLYKEVVFSQASASNPWLVSYVGAYVHSSALFGPTAVNLLEEPATVPDGPTTIPREVAFFFQNLDQTGSRTGMPKGMTDSGIMKELIDSSLQTRANYALSHFTGRYTHTVDSVSPIFPGPKPGGDLICDAMTVRDVITPAAGYAIAQTEDHPDWGNQLGPGNYGSLTVTDLHDQCFDEQIDGSMAVIIDMSGTVSIVGTPADPGATPQLLLTAPATTSPTSTTVAPPPAQAPASSPDNDVGQPGNGISAVVAVDTAGNQVTLDTNALDVTYKACPSMNLSKLQAGDFIVAQINEAIPCLSGAQVLTPPQPPQCQSVGFDGQITATWTGFSNSADSILYQRTGTGENQPVVALRWCDAPTITGSNGSAIALSQIRPGATVQITFAGGMEGPWLQSVVVQS
jgi:hypothetical protein